jgi:hypothetical protein
MTVLDTCICEIALLRLWRRAYLLHHQDLKLLEDLSNGHFPLPVTNSSGKKAR